MKEALFYRKLKEKAVQCRLCPHNCSLRPGERGSCGVRENVKGKLRSLVYGKLCSISADAIEKKPLFHFAPGTRCLSIATVGCTMSCKFCQNWGISHPPGGGVFGREMKAREIVRLAREQGLPGIAYTYTEPLIAIEFYLEIMKLARKAGLYNVWVSNGYANPEPARKVSKYLDAINMDLKGDMRFYQKLCGVRDEKPMKEALKIYREKGVWIELTNLLIPGHNDRYRQIRELVNWVKRELGPDTPLHFSRFWPCYRMGNAKPTPVRTLERAWETASKAGMKYVYIGNVPGHERENTRCPGCGEIAIKRTGYHIGFIREKCPGCGERIPLAGKEYG